MTPFLEMNDIVKRFPGVVANDHINLTIEEGEIHALPAIESPARTDN